MSKEWSATLVRTLYWIFPKTSEMGQAVIALVYGEGAPHGLTQNLHPSTFISTAVFGLVCLTLASWLFQRKEF